jgi:uncharacterized protein
METASIIDITVSPKSSRSRITIDDQNQIKVYLNAPPVDGKANAELLNLFSKRLKIPKSNMEIISGEKGKKKRLAVYGLSIIEITEILKKS